MADGRVRMTITALDRTLVARLALAGDLAAHRARVLRVLADLEAHELAVLAGELDEPDTDQGRG